jgi:hypothetical protein
MSFPGVLRCEGLLKTDVSSNVVPSSPILVILMMQARHSSDTSVLTKATWRNYTGEGILRYSD